jgi:DNA-binding transcriptional MerR regulator
METMYTLQELADQTQIAPRAIRSYIAEGLISGPDSLGRNARYGRSHLDRLLLIKEFRDVQNMSLGEIRARLLSMAPEEVREVAGKAQARLKTSRDLEALSEEGDTSASRYLARLKESLGGAWGGPGEQLRPASRAVSSSRQSRADESRGEPAEERSQTSGVTPLDAVVALLAASIGSSQPNRKAKGEDWTVIEITPFAEFHVRTDVAGEDVHKFELIADYLREIFLGGLKLND